MTLFKFLNIILLSVFLIGCGSNSDQKSKDFSLQTNAQKKVINNSLELILSINNKKGHTIDSVVYSLNGKQIEATHSLESAKLGKNLIQATVFFNGEFQYLSETISILNGTLPKVYQFTLLNEYPHDISSYTQGLEFYNGELYESTGQYGQSKLRKVNYKTGEVLKNVDLSPNFFGEGLSILNDNIYQLTWQQKVGFVYDVNTLEKKSTFKYNQSKEGWGLCNDGQMLYKSDGTENIWILDPVTLEEKGNIQAYTNKGKIIGLNELEWIDGKIYANRYQKNGVAIINPNNGAIEGVIDFSSLRKKVKQHPDLDVLNGIAFNPETETIFVTGKNWDKLFEVKIDLQ
ncbi:MAG: glutaminyl-peptide cyclotransferase [Flavobacteriaceae bacterium]|nr:glutaminyl-peptide cyclotransferase [Flavobacteriaceae bacterium]